MTTALHALTDTDTAAPAPPPFLAREAEPRFHWEQTAGQVALSVDPHGRSPRLEHTVLWLLADVQRRGHVPAPTTELLRRTHRVLHPDLGTLAGLMTHEALPLMAKLEALYSQRPMDLQDVRCWHSDFTAVSPFPTGNHETGAAVLAALSFPAWHKFLAPGQ